MNGLWNVKTQSIGVEVEYRNLQTGKSVVGDSEGPISASELLAHFVLNSNCAGELVFCDGQYIGQILGAETDERSWADEIPFTFHMPESRA